MNWSLVTRLSSLIAAAIIVSGALAFTTPARAVTTYTDLTAWQTAVGTWSETTSYGAPFANISSFITVDGVSVGLSPTHNIRVVGSSWTNWCCGYTGQVLYNADASADYTIGATSAFGLFIDPSSLSTEDIVMRLSSNEMISQSVNGDGGASFFGWVGTGITGFNLSSTNTFAAGDVFSVSEVPLPGALPLFATSLGALGLLGWRRKRKQVAA